MISDYSGIVYERLFSQINMNILSRVVEYISNSTSEFVKKIDKKWLSCITGSQKIFLSRTQTVKEVRVPQNTERPFSSIKLRVLPEVNFLKVGCKISKV